MPSAEGVIAALTQPETWPDYASEIGRFTPLRPGGLLGQTFEIEVAAGTRSGRPLFTRGYVTITSLVTPDDPKALRDWFEALEDGLARYGNDEPRAVPEGGEPLVGFDLTTHEGHFMGSGHNRLLLYTHEGKAWVRAAGTWDPMPWHVDKAYKIAGSDAQHAFWGQGDDADAEPAAPARPEDRRVSDAVVIGAGPNGLAAAIRLAEAGRSVLVLEAADAPGGAVRTQELTLPGFLHDTFSSVYPASVASPVFARMPLDGRVGAPGRLLRAPAARRRGGAAVPRPRGAARARRGALDGVQRAVPGALHGAAGHDALRLPAARRSAAARPEAAGRDGADAARLGGRARQAAVRARRLARVAVRRRDARRHAAGRRRAPRSPPSISTCSATPSAGRARAAAPSA